MTALSTYLKAQRRDTMLKTYVSVAAIGKAPEIVKGFIDKNVWPISTIITKQDSVKIYFSYKWYQYHNVFKVKQAVKRFEKRNKWYYKPSIYADDFAKKDSILYRAIQKSARRIRQHNLHSRRY